LKDLAEQNPDRTDPKLHVKAAVKEGTAEQRNGRANYHGQLA